MYPLLRAGRVIAAALAGRRLEPFDESVVRLRVWPGDLDYNLHLNNGRYLTLMDLGRVDLLIRLGALPVLRRQRWNGVVGSLAIRFRRALPPFGAFELRTRALGWDEHWFFLEQRLVSRGEVSALAVVKTAFVGSTGRVAPADFVAASGGRVESPPIPEAVRRWEAAEDELQRAALPARGGGG